MKAIHKGMRRNTHTVIRPTRAGSANTATHISWRERRMDGRVTPGQDERRAVVRGYGGTLALFRPT